MIDGILSFAIRQRWLVMIGVLAMAGFGAWNFTRLPIDAVPDITNVQVQINSRAPGYSPLEVEQRITFPIETAMGGLPRLESTRSLSRYGLSQVTVIFKDGTDIYFARQLVNERIQQVRDQLPAGIETAMGPISTGLGEIYMFTVEAKPDARKASGEAYTPSRLAHDPGLDHQAAVADCSRRQRGQHRRRIREAVSRAARSRATDGLQAQLPRRHDGAGGEQCERRRRLHRAQRRAISRPHAGTGRKHRRNQGNRDRIAKRRSGAGVRRRRRQGRHGSAHRRGNAERQGSRAGHRDAADRRKQPHRGAARRRQTQGDRRVRCRTA